MIPSRTCRGQPHASPLHLTQLRKRPELPCPPPKAPLLPRKAKSRDVCPSRDFSCQEGFAKPATLSATVILESSKEKIYVINCKFPAKYSYYCKQNDFADKKRALKLGPLVKLKPVVCLLLFCCPPPSTRSVRILFCFSVPSLPLFKEKLGLNADTSSSPLGREDSERGG